MGGKHPAPAAGALFGFWGLFAALGAPPAQVRSPRGAPGRLQGKRLHAGCYKCNKKQHEKKNSRKIRPRATGAK